MSDKIVWQVLAIADCRERSTVEDTRLYQTFLTVSGKTAHSGIYLSECIDNQRTELSIYSNKPYYTW